jgi:hypothetical protein
MFKMEVKAGSSCEAVTLFLESKFIENERIFT